MHAGYLFLNTEVLGHSIDAQETLSVYLEERVDKQIHIVATYSFLKVRSQGDEKGGLVITNLSTSQEVEPGSSQKQLTCIVKFDE